MESFQLTEAYIPLDRLLKAINWANTGGMAHALVDQGEVLVNDEVESRRRRKLYKGDRVTCRGQVVKVE